MIPTLHEMFYWYFCVLLPFSLLSFILLFSLFSRLFQRKIGLAFTSTFLSNWFFISFCVFLNSLSYLSFQEKLTNSIFEGLFLKFILLPVDIIGIFIWGGLMRKSKKVIIILGTVTILFALLYPKKYEYYAITSSEGPFLINEAVHHARNPWLSQNIRFDNHVQCACAGYKVPQGFGLNPINYFLCYGIVYDCTSEQIDYCPLTPVGEYCDIQISGDL
mgnify:CR=1 FL=1